MHQAMPGDDDSETRRGLLSALRLSRVCQIEIVPPGWQRQSSSEGLPRLFHPEEARDATTPIHLMIVISPYDQRSDLSRTVRMTLLRPRIAWSNRANVDPLPPHPERISSLQAPSRTTTSMLGGDAGQGKIPLRVGDRSRCGGRQDAEPSASSRETTGVLGAPSSSEAGTCSMRRACPTQGSEAAAGSQPQALPALTAGRITGVPPLGGGHAPRDVRGASDSSEQLPARPTPTPTYVGNPGHRGGSDAPEGCPGEQRADTKTGGGYWSLSSKPPTEIGSPPETTDATPRGFPSHQAGAATTARNERPEQSSSAQRPRAPDDSDDGGVVESSVSSEARGGAAGVHGPADPVDASNRLEKGKPGKSGAEPGPSRREPSIWDLDSGSESDSDDESRPPRLAGDDEDPHSDSRPPLGSRTPFDPNHVRRKLNARGERQVSPRGATPPPGSTTPSTTGSGGTVPRTSAPTSGAVSEAAPTLPPAGFRALPRRFVPCRPQQQGRGQGRGQMNPRNGGARRENRGRGGLGAPSGASGCPGSGRVAGNARPSAGAGSGDVGSMPPPPPDPARAKMRCRRSRVCLMHSARWEGLPAPAGPLVDLLCPRCCQVPRNLCRFVFISPRHRACHARPPSLRGAIGSVVVFVSGDGSDGLGALTSCPAAPGRA